MKRLIVTIVFLFLAYASHDACLAQTNISSICLTGWSSLTNSGTLTVTLRWTNLATNADGIAIDRGSTSSGPWVPLAVVASSANVYTDKTVVCRSIYWYRVYAYNSA